MIADLGVLVLPSRNANTWRASLEKSAIDAAWRYEQVPTGSPPAATPGQTIIFATESAAVFADFPLDRTVVVYWPGEEVVELLIAMDPEGQPSHAIGRASLFLAAADDLVGRGAKAIAGHEPLSALNAAFSPAPLTDLLPPQLDPVRALSIYETWPAAADSTMTWSTSILRFPKGRSQEGGAADMVLAGPPRLLMHGPYIHLPTGNWRVTVRLAVETEGHTVKVLFEWGNAGVHGGELLEFTKDGEYELSMEANVTADLPVELRASLVRASLQGRLKVSDLEIDRL